jgi:DNA-directed RNA polymerase subunit RPC12/RpoP
MATPDTESSPPEAPPPGPAGGGRTFPCERCGADLVFNIGAQSLRCDHCGFVKALEFEPGREVGENDLEAALRGIARRRAEARPAAAGKQELRCEACGATVVFQGTLTSSKCAYCGEPVQREKAHAAPERIPVDGLLTFMVPAEQAKGALRDWVKGRWFAPNAWKQQGVEGRLDGAYLPFFTFDAMTASQYRGERGDRYTVTVRVGNQTRNEVRVRWTPASGAFQRFFDDVLVPAFRSLPMGLLAKLEPWPLERTVPFTEGALAGKLAHTYDLELPQGFASARERIEREIEAEVRHRIGGDTQRIHDVRTQYAGLTYKHLLLPVWLLAYRFHERSYRVAINAVTGEVHGERPWSAVKIALAVVAAAIVAGAIWLATQGTGGTATGY